MIDEYEMMDWFKVEDKIWFDHKEEYNIIKKDFVRLQVVVAQAFKRSHKYAYSPSTYDDILKRLMSYINYSFRYDKVISVGLDKHDALATLIKILVDLDIILFEKGTGYLDGETQVMIGSKFLAKFSVNSPAYLSHLPFRKTTDVVLVKDKKTKKKTPCPRRIAEKYGAKFIKEYNRYALKHDITVDVDEGTFDSDHRYSGITGNLKLNPQLRRIFSNELERGGRLYVNDIIGYQFFPKALRKNIKINGNSTVSMDYSSILPNILYQKVGSCLTGKAYAIQNGRELAPEERALVKLILLATFNADSELGTINAVVKIKYGVYENKEVRDYIAIHGVDGLRNKVKYYMSELEAIHPEIKHFFYTGIGAYAQFEDSELMLNVLTQLKSEGILGLPVHDSVSVESIHGERLREIMQNEFKLMYDTDFVIGVDEE